LLLNQWQPLNDLLPRLRERMAVNDGGKFILENWNCKYVEIRLDMRIGVAYVIPGSGPNLEKTLRLQAEHERDCAVEEVARLHELLAKAHGVWPEGSSRIENCKVTEDVPASITFPPEMSMAESHGDPRITGHVRTSRCPHGVSHLNRCERCD
jgi:hypothetical protein